MDAAMQRGGSQIHLHEEFLSQMQLTFTEEYNKMVFEISEQTCAKKEIKRWMNNLANLLERRESGR